MIYLRNRKKEKMIIYWMNNVDKKDLCHLQPFLLSSDNLVKKFFVTMFKR